MKTAASIPLQNQRSSVFSQANSPKDTKLSKKKKKVKSRKGSTTREHANSKRKAYQKELYL